MAVPFVVEDGTGLTDATAYIDVTYADNYIETYAPPSDSAAWALLTDPEKERAIMVATQYIDDNFTFIGNKLTCDQALEWPRDVVCDCNGCAITGVPVQVQKATAEYSYRAISENLNPDPQVNLKGRVTMEKVCEIERRYSENYGYVITVPYPSADKKLKCLTIDQSRIIRG